MNWRTIKLNIDQSDHENVYFQIAYATEFVFMLYAPSSYLETKSNRCCAQKSFASPHFPSQVIQSFLIDDDTLFFVVCKGAQRRILYQQCTSSKLLAITSDSENIIKAVGNMSYVQLLFLVPVDKRGCEMKHAADSEFQTTVTLECIIYHSTLLSISVSS